jgi:hypothetical protein
VTVGSEIGNIQKEKYTSAAAAGLAAKYQSTFTLNEAARKSICANAFGRGLSLPKMQSGAHGLRNQRHSRRLTQLSQLRAIFGIFGLIFVVKSCVSIVEL